VTTFRSPFNHEDVCRIAFILPSAVLLFEIMQTDQDFWWFAANIAYHLVGVALKLAIFLAVMVATYLAFTVFGGLGLAVAFVLVAAWRLTKDIADIDAESHAPDHDRENSHKRK